MKATRFCFILLIFFIENHHINALQCYSCLSVGQNITDCHDPLNTNRTLVLTATVTTSDALCTKMVGTLSNDQKFTLRRASPTGCPRGINTTDIVRDTPGVIIKDVTIFCCNTKLCNHAVSREHIQWFFLFSIALIYWFHSFL